jgi:hypothetical protein
MFFFLNWNDLKGEGVPTWRRVYAWISLVAISIGALIAAFFVITAIVSATKNGLGGLGGLTGGSTEGVETTGTSGFFCLPCCFPLPLALLGGLPFFHKMKEHDIEGFINPAPTDDE